ncbi:MAG: inovirus Gp2 family protein [Pseudomonadota bacterium]
MKNRHSANLNLKLHYQATWHDYSVQASIDRPLVELYLWNIFKTMNYAVQEFPRTVVFRFDLRFPFYWPAVDTGVISRFFESLCAKIEADLNRKARDGKRVHPNRVRYVWVKEINDSENLHYHVAILVNLDTYATLGKFRENDADLWVDMPKDPKAEKHYGLGEMINSAFASALRCEPYMVRGAVNFTRDGRYKIDKGSNDYDDQFAAAFWRLSYLAKAETKSYGDWSNWFGSSRG